MVHKQYNTAVQNQLLDVSLKHYSLNTSEHEEERFRINLRSTTGWHTKWQSHWRGPAVKGNLPSLTSFATAVATTHMWLVSQSAYRTLPLPISGTEQHFLFPVQLPFFIKLRPRIQKENASFTCPLWNTMNAQSARNGRNSLSKEKVNRQVVKTPSHTAETRQVSLSKAWPATHTHPMALSPSAPDLRTTRDASLRLQTLYPLVT